MRRNSDHTVVAAAGTAVQLHDSPARVKSIVIKARTGTIYVGESDVSSTNGVELKAGRSISYAFGDGSVPMSDFWIDGAANNDAGDWTAVLF